jgi:hypothetical protein
MIKDFKFIISSASIILFLVINFATPANAQFNSTQSLQDCIQKCLKSREEAGGEGANTTNRYQCQVECRQGTPEYIPPIPKPSLLPGPTFRNENKRTGQEINEFVTVKFLPKLATRLITIAAITSMLGLVYGGLLFFSALGDPEKANKGKNAAIYAIVGLIISLLSFTIVQIISNLPLSTL